MVYLEPGALSSAHHAAQWYASTADLAEPFLQAVEAAIVRARSWPDAYPQVRRSRDLAVRHQARRPPG